MSIDHKLAEVARANHGIIPLASARSLGMSRYQIDKRVRDGTLMRVHDRALAAAGAPQTWEFKIAAALAALPRCVVSHQSAARLHNMWVPHRDDQIVVCGPDSIHHALQGVRVRRTRRLRDLHLTEIAGFPVTTRARTIIDLAADLGEMRLRRLIDDDLASGRTTWADFDETFITTAKRGKKGIARARKVLSAIAGSPPAESALEREFLELLRRFELPEPQTQVPAPWWATEPGRVDAFFPAAKLIVELDGKQFHVRESAFETDRRRDQLALVHGFRTVRFTWRQVVHDPGQVAQVMNALLSDRAA